MIVQFLAKKTRNQGPFAWEKKVSIINVGWKKCIMIIISMKWMQDENILFNFTVLYLRVNYTIGNLVIIFFY